MVFLEESLKIKQNANYDRTYKKVVFVVLKRRTNWFTHSLIYLCKQVGQNYIVTRLLCAFCLISNSSSWIPCITDLITQTTGAVLNRKLAGYCPWIVLFFFFLASCISSWIPCITDLITQATGAVYNNASMCLYILSVNNRISLLDFCWHTS